MRIKTLALAGLAAVLLTACGGGDDEASSSGSGSSSSSSSASSASGLADKSGPEVAKAAADALEGVDAVHVKGDGTSDGQQLALDLQVQGEDLSGTISNAGQTLQIIHTGGQTYAQAPAEFWSSQGVPAEAVGQLAGKWVTLPAEVGDSLSGISLQDLVSELRNPTDGAYQDDVTTDTRDGKKVVVLKQAGGSTLQVAAEGEPYPLYSETKGDEPGTLTFSGFGEKQAIAAPPSPLDLSQAGA